jgi:hypothetical protein
VTTWLSLQGAVLAGALLYAWLAVALVLFVLNYRGRTL